MKTNGEIEAYPIAQCWRHIILQNTAHVWSFVVARRAEHVTRKVHLQRAEKHRRNIQVHVLVRFRFVILDRIQHQPRHFLAPARAPSLEAVFAVLTGAPRCRRSFWLAANGATVKWNALTGSAFGKLGFWKCPNGN